MQSSDRQGRRHRDLTRSPPVGYKDSLPRVRQSPSVVPCHRDTFLFRLLSSVHVRFGCDLPVQVGTLSLARYLLCVCVCVRSARRLYQQSPLSSGQTFPAAVASSFAVQSSARPPACLPACLLRQSVTPDFERKRRRSDAYARAQGRIIKRQLRDQRTKSLELRTV